MEPAQSNTSEFSLNTVYREVRKGAAIGGLTGATLLCAVIAGGLFFTILESGNRSRGSEPKWPIFKNDCQLEKFRDLSVCTHPSGSLMHFTIYLVGVMTICGMLARAISVTAKQVFYQTQ